jgi:hypothetical protein
MIVDDHRRVCGHSSGVQQSSLIKYGLSIRHLGTRWIEMLEDDLSPSGLLPEEDHEHIVSRTT